MPDVRLVDLELIKRFSLAVRRDTVPAEELLEALDASRALVVAAMNSAPTEGGGGRPTPAKKIARRSRPPKPAGPTDKTLTKATAKTSAESTAAKTPVAKTPARKGPVKGTPAAKAPARKGPVKGTPAAKAPARKGPVKGTPAAKAPANTGPAL